MKFSQQVFEGRFLRRYKRFFADVEINGETQVVHVANTGSMKGCNEPNSLCRVTYANSSTRKLQYTLEMIKPQSSWIGVNTSRPNTLVRELWEGRKYSPWSPFDRIQSEVRISENSRIDFVIWNSNEFEGEKLIKPNFKKLKGPFHFVEVKNVSLGEDGVALFPDSVTTRGQKHIDELVRLVRQGHSAEMLYVVQREDCLSFAPADSIDPEYGRKLRAAMTAGVKVTAMTCHLSISEIALKPKALPLKL